MPTWRSRRTSRRWWRTCARLRGRRRGKPVAFSTGPDKSPDPLRRGEYLVHAGMCGLCHTPVDPAGIYLADTHYLAGGMKIDAGAHGILFSRNLTPDAATGLGSWSVEQIATAIRTGHTPERRLNYWGMPWMVLGALSDEDARAIATYLKTLPAVHNQVPQPLRYGFVETVARKLTYGWPALMPAAAGLLCRQFRLRAAGTSAPRLAAERAHLDAVCGDRRRADCVGDHAAATGRAGRPAPRRGHDLHRAYARPRRGGGGGLPLSGDRSLAGGGGRSTPSRAASRNRRPMACRRIRRPSWSVGAISTPSARAPIATVATAPAAAR